MDLFLQEVNLRWFGISSRHPHSAEGAPVTPLLEALDQCQNEYVLQLDCDLMLSTLTGTQIAG